MWKQKGREGKFPIKEKAKKKEKKGNSQSKSGRKQKEDKENSQSKNGRKKKKREEKKESSISNLESRWRIVVCNSKSNVHFDGCSIL